MKEREEGRRSKEVKDLGASVRARLLNIAKQTNRDFNAVLLQYFQERFLYRLSVSSHDSAFILKGALMQLAHHMLRLRPTKDIDLLGMGVSNDPGDVQKIIQQIVRIESHDAVVFDPENIHAERIADGAEHSSVRVKLRATLHGARTVLQLDVGFGDEIVAGPIRMDFPVLLDMPVPTIQVYSRESSIAEKFQALVKRNLLSSRMKDIYDILSLAEMESFKLDVLREALNTTFSHRGTDMGDRSVVFTESFAIDADRQAQWRSFLRRDRIDSYVEFPQAMGRLKDFLEPVCDRKFNPQNATWDIASRQWK
jgi:predicted nucleotidyltransferase component of viral defense system